MILIEAEANSESIRHLCVVGVCVVRGVTGHGHVIRADERQRTRELPQNAKREQNIGEK